MNSELYDKKYPIPQEIIKQVSAKIYASQDKGEGIKRAKFIVNNGYCTYSMMKRIKNFFDSFNPQGDSREQYELAGGDLMRKWIENTLRHDRTSLKISDKVHQEINPDVSSNKFTMKAQSGSVNLGVTESVISESVDLMIRHNAIAVIYDKEGKVLLAKRSPETEQWMPDKWALVGGSVEMGEEPVNGIQREVFEEVGLSLDNYVLAFGVDKSENSKLHVFTAYYEGDPFAIKLNEEHTAYGWFTIPEMEYIDGVPNLVLFVTTALSKVNES